LYCNGIGRLQTKKCRLGFQAFFALSETKKIQRVFRWFFYLPLIQCKAYRFTSRLYSQKWQSRAYVDKIGACADKIGACADKVGKN